MPSLPYSLEALLLDRSRYISGGSTTIIPDVTITEQAVDEVQVTEHPVDTGANIADHAFKKNSVIRCQFGWSDSSRLINSVLDGSILKGLTTIQKVYEKLYELMEKRELLNLKTGKKLFKNVLITRLEQTTSEETESALICDVTFTQVQVVESSLVAVQTSDMADKTKMEGVKNQGTKQAQLRS